MSGEEKEKNKILHVANISTAATRDHVYNMFNYLGKIQEMRIYPSEGNITASTLLKTAFIKFDDERCAEVGQHLTNTVLIDRAIVCLPYPNQFIPDEESFFNSGGSTTAGQRQLPPHVTNKVQELEDGTSVLITVDPTLEQLGLPAYPPLPADTDYSKVEEIRRTVYVGNLPKGIDGKEVLEMFNMYFGEVMYVRMASGPDALPCAYAYVEFSQQASVSNALQNDGFEFKERPLKIQHSRVPIIKPQAKTDEQALGEVEEAIRLGRSADDRDRRRSRSPRRRRTPSPRRRRDSRERDRDRDRDRERDRDRDRDRDRKRSRDRRSRSRDRDRDRKRSRSRDRKKRSRSRDKDRDNKDRDRKRSRSRDRKRRSKSRDRKRERSRSKSRDRKREKKRSRSRSHDRKRDKEDRKNEKKENENETVLREKLLEKKAARKDSSDDEWEEKPVTINGDAKKEEVGNGDSDTSFQ
ncbi:CRE-RSP-7 protein [Caenorhabditis remanei]|uniref:CRE-RSP-7 protein n=1 Tax=Caenorhabditis remanei TaxID=31234 RepID=E3LFM0_CAERE|nr:CRE-RSP-7 protein [Caenorhabditis remanei]